MDNMIRNIDTSTTGDFVAFEFLKDGAWLPAAISGSALRILNGPGAIHQEAAIIAQNQNRIWRAAMEQPAVEGTRVLVTSDDIR